MICRPMAVSTVGRAKKTVALVWLAAFACGSIVAYVAVRCVGEVVHGRRGKKCVIRAYSRFIFSLIPIRTRSIRFNGFIYMHAMGKVVWVEVLVYIHTCML